MEEKKPQKRPVAKNQKQGYVFYNHRRATPVIFIGIVIALCALIILGVIVGVRSSVKLSSVKIEGKTKYTEEDLLVASGIKIGDKIHKIDIKSSKNKMLDGCPYLSEVKITKSGAGTLKIKVKESKPQMYLLSGNGAFILDGDFRLLEISDDATAWKSSDLIRISGTNLSYTKLGAPIKFGGENSLTREDVSEILKSISQFKYCADVDFVSFYDKFSIYFTCGEKFKVVLGDRFDIPEKLKTAGQMMDAYETSTQTGLVVNVFDLSAPFVGSR